MAKKNTDFKITKPKYIITAAAGLFASIIAVYFYTVYVVFPAAGQFLVVEIPAKTGGRSYLTELGEFQTTSYIVMGIAAAFLAAISLLVAKQKYTSAFLTAILFSSGAGFYNAVMLGNGFHALWDGWWSVVGVLIAVAISMGAVALIVFSQEIKLAGSPKKQ